MEGVTTAALIGLLVFLASVVSVEMGISVAIIEIALGIVGGNLLGIRPTPWLAYLATFGGILLTFLAGAEVDIPVMRAKFKESILIGTVSFLAPFVGAFAYCYYIAGWSFRAAEIAGVALSTTSLAVVYAVLVETGLTEKEIGKIIMASCFVTDFGVALALSLLFLEPGLYTLLFAVASVAIILTTPRVTPWIFKKYGERVIEPEIKFIFFLVLLLILLADMGASHAILPAFVLGLVLSDQFRANRLLQRRMRVVAFAMLTPFFFINGGLNLSLGLLYANLGLLAVLFIVKLGTKISGVYPLARRYVAGDAVYTTLLMSTGLTMGTIASTFGLNSGILDQAQFSVLVAVVVLSAILPTFVAQRWFEPV